MQVQKSRLFCCSRFQTNVNILIHFVVVYLTFVKRMLLVTEHKYDRQINQINTPKKKTCHSHFLASYWSLGPCERRAENRDVRRENDDKRTEGLLVRFPCWHWKCWKVRVQSRLLPVLYAAARSTKAEWKNKHISGKKHHCKQQKMLVVTKLGSWKKHSIKEMELITIKLTTEHQTRTHCCCKAPFQLPVSISLFLQTLHQSWYRETKLSISTGKNFFICSLQASV